MRTSEYLLGTQRGKPTEAETISHQLMIRSGMIRQLASGLYNWMPLGLRVLRKVEAIVRKEMDLSGALEVLMPIVQPSELWQESSRLEQYGPELLRLQDRHERPFCLGPTHEEVITDLIRREIQSYKQLPLNLYQIQTKFRDEIRPRFGVMRAREFIMKDAYSFHLDTDCLAQTYKIMHQTYCRIFERIGLDFRPVLADTGSIGGYASHEFHVLAESGEDSIAFSNESNYAANVELAEAVMPDIEHSTPKQNLTEIDTPNIQSIEDLCEQLKEPAEKILKTLIVKATPEADSAYIAICLRGDHELNPIKAEKHPWVQAPLQFVNTQTLATETQLPAGYLGPIDINLPILVDHSAGTLVDFICGANKKNLHFTGANWGRDCPTHGTHDLRKVITGDPSPDGHGTLQIKRGIEVGHIFQLGNKYSQALKATVLNEQGKATTLEMGCYGIGISRIVAATIEQHHDETGIIWPDAIAPFTVGIIPLNYEKSKQVKSTTESLYNQFIALGIDTLLDDRPERPGVKFTDIELIGIPHQLIIGEKSLGREVIEYKNRKTQEKADIPIQNIVEFIQQQLQNGVGL